jgi:hypothetical protein
MCIVFRDLEEDGRFVYYNQYLLKTAKGGNHSLRMIIIKHSFCINNLMRGCFEMFIKGMGALNAS